MKPRSASAWLLCSVLALGSACIADLIAAPVPPLVKFFLMLIGLGLPLALVHGALWWLTFSGLARLPRRLPVVVWPLLWLGVAALLADELGGFSRLNTRYHKLALEVLAGCGVAALALSALCAAFQPSHRRELGYLPGLPARVRVLCAAALLGGGFGLWFADRRLFPGQYPDGHLALRLTSVWCAMFAFALGTLRLRLPRFGWRALAAVALALVVCLALPDDRRVLQPLSSRPWPASFLRIYRNLTDWDRDGYSSFLGGGDCAPFNPRIHPGAREIPDNGVDENCMLGDAKKKLETIAQLPVPPFPSPLDVVLITLDSLRPDHLGMYDARYGPKGRATSPNLDAFAQHATVFDHAYTPGAWTTVAIPSILRGVYPRRLRWTKYFETNFYSVLRKPVGPKLRPGEVTLHMFPLAFGDPHPPIASILLRRGMWTAAVTDDGHSEMLQRGTGVEQGFVGYQEVDSLPAPRRNDAGTADLAIAALQRMPKKQRFFLWVHFFGTHWPDDTHPEVRSYGNEIADRYDHEVLYLDLQLGRLLRAIEARATPTAVFVLADHGEQLLYGRQHGLTLEEPVIRIPLLVRVPGWQPGHVRQLVSSIDLVPTILALTRSPLPSYLDGLDLGPLITAEQAKPRVLFSDTWRFDQDERPELNFVAAFDGSNKVVLDRLAGTLYDYNQRDEATPLQLSDAFAFDGLTRAIYAYLEETGGALNLSD